MTNFDAISAETYPYCVDDRVIVKSCIDHGLDAEDVYDPYDRKPVATAAAVILCKMICLYSEGNGDYMFRYDIPGLERRIYLLAKENELDELVAEFGGAMAWGHDDSYNRKV